MTLILRPAREEDRDLLFSWRNDPETFRYFLTPEPVEYATHVRWFAESLRSTTRQIYIGEMNGIPVGMIRADRETGRTKLSWLIAPESRGRGVGKKLLREARLLLDGELWADILPGNTASVKIAEAAGFHFVNEKNGVCHYRSVSQT